MAFFNDECDLVDDDRYDLFTLTTQIERLHPSRGARKRQPAPKDRRLRPLLAMPPSPFVETGG
jgi:hypothetical protein